MEALPVIEGPHDRCGWCGYLLVMRAPSETNPTICTECDEELQEAWAS